MATSDAPVSIGSVTLIVNNLAKVSGFYRSVIGLNEISSSANECCLGNANTPLLNLIQDKHARRYPQDAGLFHTAFLLPNRSSLGEWYRFIKERGIRLDGAANHGVSEALYLSDPEGNGVEIYADTDRSTWKIGNDGKIIINSKPLKDNSFLGSARKNWMGAPEGTVIGHVHLQVGELRTADDFYVNSLGFTCTSSMESASFYGSGGYHHHLAGNIWNSRGAGQKSRDSTGLLEVELLVSDPASSLKNSVDPWGTKFLINHVSSSSTSSNQVSL